MNLTADTMNDMADALILAIGWALVLFLFQGLMIGLGVAGLIRAFRGRSARLRYTVALAAVLLMALCPAVTTLGGLATRMRPPESAAPVPAPEVALGGAPEAVAPSRELTPARASVSGTTSNGEAIRAAGTAPVPLPESRQDWRRRIEGWLPAVIAFWCLGVCVSAPRLVAGLVEVRGLTRRGIVAPPGELLATMARLLEHFSLRRPIRCVVSPRIEVTAVVGWLRPTVLIPAANLTRLTARQLEVLLAHELAHIRRHDYLVNLCQVVIETLLFFHPAVWWASRRIRIEREHCCDDLAVAFCGGDRLLVARTLVTLEELRGTPALRVAAAGGSLRDRVLRLVTPTPADGCRGGAGWVGAGLMGVAAGLIALGWHPGTTRAQDEPAGLEGAGKTGAAGTERSTPADLTLAKLVEELRRAESGVEGLSTDYVSEARNYFWHPGDAPIPAGLIEDDAISSSPRSQVSWEATADGRGRSEANSHVTHLRADGSEVHKTWVTLSTFDGSQGRALETRIVADGPIARHGIITEEHWASSMNPFNFTTHHLGAPVSEVLGQGGGVIVGEREFEGRTVVVVETAPLTRDDGYTSKRRYFIDPARNHVVMRRQVLEPQGDGAHWAVHLQTDSLRHEEVRPGVWLPKVVTHTNHAVPDEGARRLVAEEEISVLSWRVNEIPDPARFRLEFPEGVPMNRAGDGR